MCGTHAWCPCNRLCATPHTVTPPHLHTIAASLQRQRKFLNSSEKTVQHGRKVKRWRPVPKNRLVTALAGTSSFRISIQGVTRFAYHNVPWDMISTMPTNNEDLRAQEREAFNHSGRRWKNGFNGSSRKGLPCGTR